MELIEKIQYDRDQTKQQIKSIYNMYNIVFNQELEAVRREPRLMDLT